MGCVIILTICSIHRGAVFIIPNPAPTEATDAGAITIWGHMRLCSRRLGATGTKRRERFIWVYSRCLAVSQMSPRDFPGKREKKRIEKRPLPKRPAELGGTRTK